LLNTLKRLKAAIDRSIIICLRLDYHKELKTMELKNTNNYNNY